MSPIEDPELEFDQEGNIGLERDSNSNVKSILKKSEEENTDSTKAKQILLRNDRVFVLREPGKWNLSAKRRDCDYTTGVVILNKEQTLSIRWEQGETKKLNNKSDTFAYGERVKPIRDIMFVLDREGLQQGSRVFLADHPDITGTVVEKRFVVTANIVGESDAVFEGVDARALKRYTYGKGFKDNKILYKGWLGITAGYRVRIHLKGVEDGCEFSLLDNGQYSEDLVIGQEVNIGLNLLWGAQWTEGANWFTNFFRYYNTSATVTNIEMEELDACWFGRAGNPQANPNPLDLVDAPEKIIAFEDLTHVQYLVSDYCHYMTRGSLWTYKASTATGPISKDAWASKWMKIVDFDRWEYPEPEKVAYNSSYFDRELTLTVGYTRSVVDVVWDNDTENTVNSADVIPIHLGTVWSEMVKHYPGSIVGDRLEFSNPQKYGIVMRIVEMIATVKWISPDVTGSQHFDVTETTASLYDLYEKSEYEYISRTTQCPIVSSEGRFKVGVVSGMNSATGQVRVNLPDGHQELAWPHELVHYKCDVTYCPKEGHWMTYYDHIIPEKSTISMRVSPMSPSGVEEICDVENEKANTSIVLESLTPKKQLEALPDVPDDNIFALEDVLPPLRATHFRHAVENEVDEMENLPEGMWLEYYNNRGDIMSTVLTGPKDTVFEDFLFIFDIFLMEDFPNSDPYINFRSLGVCLFPRHFCKSGAVFLPEETTLPYKDFTTSYILNVLLEIKDFMALPLEKILDNDNAAKIHVKQEDPEELHKFLLLSVLDYTIALLRSPPTNWGSVIHRHFSQALPKIVERYESGQTQFRRVKASLSNEKVGDSDAVGDVPKLEDFELLTNPWSESYRESIRSRVRQLQSILSSSSQEK